MTLAVACNCTVVCARPAAPTAGAAAISRPQLAAQRPARLQRRQRSAPVQATGSSGSSGAPQAAAAADVGKQVEVLQRACRRKDVPPEEVLAAMQAVEAAHLSQPLVQGAAAAAAAADAAAAAAAAAADAADAAPDAHPDAHDCRHAGCHGVPHNHPALPPPPLQASPPRSQAPGAWSFPPPPPSSSGSTSQ